MPLLRYRTISVIVFSLASFIPSVSSLRAETLPLDQLPYTHGLSVASSTPPQLYLATRQGVFLGTPDGQATTIGSLWDDLLGFTSDPSDIKTLLASGQPPDGGSLGLMKSTDGGVTWQKISEGINKKENFQILAISKADPKIIYGNFKDPQISRDGGKTWTDGVTLPDGELIGLAASAIDKDRLYAATTKSLFFSVDSGTSWNQAYMLNKPSTTVHAASGGKLYAFIYGVGLVVTQEPTFAWKTLSNDFADRYMLNLTVDPSDPQRLYAMADTGTLMTSDDGGSTWRTFEGSHTATPEAIAKGKSLFKENCEVCHGVEGIGENPKDMYAEDEFGFKAPALNNDAHAWHHSDTNITENILNGSDRNKRMIAWKDQLSTDQVQNIVSYIKSLWSFRSLACQGARHMACMSHQ